MKTLPRITFAPTVILAGLSLAIFAPARPTRAADNEPPKEYKAATIGDDELEQLRDDFLAHVNQQRKAGRDDKKADREKVPGDLRFDPILNAAAQYMADLMAQFDDKTGKGGGNGHDATVFGAPASLKDPVQRIRHFGWPANDNTYPGAGCEAAAALVRPTAEVKGGMIADVWMNGSTHYRPFFAYKDKKIGDQDFELVGLGVGKAKSGNYYTCAVFGNPIAPTVKLTEEQLKALPAQIIAEINAARAKAGLAPVAADDKLTATAHAAAEKMGAKKDALNDEEAPKSEFAGGVGNTFNKGTQLKDAKSFAAFVVEGNDAYLLEGKFKSIGVGIALDDDGVPYIAVYAGHP